MNFLEELIAEWYEYSGYFVRRNVRVGRRSAGGHEGELDVVAFHPVDRRLVHIEASMDADSWPEREKRFARKFSAGDRHIRNLFEGLEIPPEIEKRAVFGIGSRKNRSSLAGAEVVLLRDFLQEVLDGLRKASWSSQAVPEHFPILRTLQVSWEYRDLFSAGSRPEG